MDGLMFGLHQPQTLANILITIWSIKEQQQQKKSMQ